MKSRTWFGDQLDQACEQKELSNIRSWPAMKPLNSTDLAKSISYGTTLLSIASYASLIVFGQLPSMKNSKIQSVKKGRAYTFKNPAVVAYERNFGIQVKPEAKKHLGSPTEPLRAIVTVFYPSMRSDLDCALVYDCLQTAGVIANDRYIREKHEYAAIDKDNPRVQIEIDGHVIMPHYRLTKEDSRKAVAALKALSPTEKARWRDRVHRANKRTGGFMVKHDVRDTDNRSAEEMIIYYEARIEALLARIRELEEGAKAQASE